jgi:ribosome-binding factor A
MSRKSKTRFGLPALAGQEPRRRPARVADLIQKEVATLLLTKVKDPRLAEISISRVKVTDDLKNAICYYTSYTGKEKDSDQQKGLDKARGFFRSHLASTLKLRQVPKLVFEPDASFYNQIEMEKLLNEIKEEDEATGSNSQDS